MAWQLHENFHELCAGVFLVVGPASNWIIARDGDSTLLIDGGYPDDAGRVEDSLLLAGAASRPDAVLLTHAHVDHLGAALLLAPQGVPIWCAHDEIGNATGEAPEQIAPANALSLASADPLWEQWANHAMSAGGMTRDRLRCDQLRTFSPGATLDLPGTPRTLSSASHTSGHVSFECGDVLVTGDALITGHPTSTTHGPQLLHRLFHHQPAQVADVAAQLIARTSARSIAPGHGEPATVADVRAALPLSDGPRDLD